MSDSPALLFSLTAAVCYAGSAALIGSRLRRPLIYPTTGTAGSSGWRLLSVAALAAQGTGILAEIAYQGGVPLGLFNAAALVALVVAVLFIVTSLFRPIESLGVVILPLTGLLALLATWLPGPPPHPTLGTLAVTHVIVALIAYGLLAIAVLQGLLLELQERRLRSHRPASLLATLPPVETMEGLMWNLLTLGFLLLTATLVSGVLFSETLFGRALPFTHHTILSLIAWVVFGVLLAGRLRYGWRGRPALRLALVAFALLVLGYFGTKFVLEILLHRG